LGEDDVEIEVDGGFLETGLCGEDGVEMALAALAPAVAEDGAGGVEIHFDDEAVEIGGLVVQAFAETQGLNDFGLRAGCGFSDAIGGQVAPAGIGVAELETIGGVDEMPGVKDFVGDSGVGLGPEMLHAGGDVGRLIAGGRSRGRDDGAVGRMGLDVVEHVDFDVETAFAGRHGFIQHGVEIFFIHPGGRY